MDGRGLSDDIAFTGKFPWCLSSSWKPLINKYREIIRLSSVSTNFMNVFDFHMMFGFRPRYICPSYGISVDQEVIINLFPEKNHKTTWFNYRKSDEILIRASRGSHCLVDPFLIQWSHDLVWVDPGTNDIVPGFQILGTGFARKRFFPMVSFWPSTVRQTVIRNCPRNIF